MIDQLKQFSDLSVVLTTFVSNRAPGGAYLAPSHPARGELCRIVRHSYAASTPAEESGLSADARQAGEVTTDRAPMDAWRAPIPR